MSDFFIEATADARRTMKERYLEHTRGLDSKRAHDVSITNEKG
jgi:hypothetical protein